MAGGMDIKGEINKRKADSRNLTDKNYAFGHYVNDACLKRGEELVQEVVKAREKRSEDVKKDIQAQAKEAAHYLGGVARHRLTFGGKAAYCCFDCEYKGLGLKDEHGQSLCGMKCNNGEYFTPKKEGEESNDQEHK